VINGLGDSGHVDDACGGCGDDWYCNQREWILMKVVTMIVLIFTIMMEINIDINDNYNHEWEMMIW